MCHHLTRLASAIEPKYLHHLRGASRLGSGESRGAILRTQGAPCGEPPHAPAGVGARSRERRRALPAGARRGRFGTLSGFRIYLVGAVRIAMWLAPARFAVDMMSTAAPSSTLLSPRISRVSD